MKALSRKCTAFLLSLTLLLTLAPTALASEALGDDLDLRSTTLNRGAELGEGTFWSNTFSDLRQENYVVYTPNTSVTPIVTYGDYTTATSTVSAAAKRLEEQGLRVVAGINGDYYDTLNGAPLGTVMTGGVPAVMIGSAVVWFIGLVGLFVLGYLVMVAEQVYRASLYLYAQYDVVGADFSEDEIAGAFKMKK